MDDKRRKILSDIDRALGRLQGATCDLDGPRATVIINSIRAIKEALKEIAV